MKFYRYLPGACLRWPDLHDMPHYLWLACRAEIDAIEGR